MTKRHLPPPATLYTVADIASKLGRTHPAISDAIRRINLQAFAHTRSGKPLYTEDNCEVIKRAMRQPNRK